MICRVSTRSVSLIQMPTTVGQVTRVGGTILQVTCRPSVATRCANVARNSDELLSNLLQCYCKANGYKRSMNKRGF